MVYIALVDINNNLYKYAVVYVCVCLFVNADSNSIHSVAVFIARYASERERYVCVVYYHYHKRLFH